MGILLAVFFAALGALVASFVTVVSERAYTGQSWKRGRSKCGSCREPLAAHDLVPVLSWLMLAGRCRSCGSRFPFRYVLVEAVLGVLFALSYLTLGLGLPLVAFLFALSILLFVVLYDLRHTIVPPAASLLLFAASASFAFLTHAGTSALGLTILIAGGISLFLFLLHALSRGRAMGLGDAPVAFSLALLAGGTHAFAGILFSFWIGAVVGIGVLLVRRGGPTMGIEVPFVPFLAAGFLLAYFTQWNPFPLFMP
ncbi:MAG: leader peptidase (prepilin peptidase) / N-methyltransferase [Candidatus Parcubacteria bacterium]|jgi:prepilin signal peptidase PulO-like enzyme (type II secretory pathway)|nr:leader peptidase (prepilin peptidase) / N-methyltransferase [Candidatus Parcubacteria bacterium]